MKLYNTLTKTIDELTAVSDAAAEYVRTMTDAPVTIIPNGIDLSDFKVPKTFNRPEGKVRTLLYLGRLERRKGVITLLDAYAELVKTTKNVRLVIAGDGPDRRKLELHAYELNLSNVEFLGYVTDREKHQLLRSADLFCAPALYGESFGIVLLEAMASGLVTVASNNPGYAAVLQELGSISLVQPKDPVEFSRRIGVLLDNEELRKLWRNWALEYVKRFDYAKIIDQYEEVYETAHKKHKQILDMSDINGSVT